MSNQSSRGFTLLEILLVVAAIAILAGIVIVAINPVKQLGQTRDAQRLTDVNTISSAIFQYYIDNEMLPSSIPLDDTLSCTDKAATSRFGICVTGTTCSPGFRLDEDLAPDYLSVLPSDPSGSSANFTGYIAFRTSAHRVFVCAPKVETAGDIHAYR